MLVSASVVNSELLGRLLYILEIRECYDSVGGCFVHQLLVELYFVIWNDVGYSVRENSFVVVVVVAATGSLV